MAVLEGSKNSNSARNSDAADITLDGTIAAGSRNETLTKLAGSFRSSGFNTDAIFNQLTLINASQCEPPLGEEEVRRIAESIGGKQFVPTTDTQLAEEFSNAYRDKLVYCSPLNSFYFWDGKTWVKDEALYYMKLAKDFVRSLFVRVASSPFSKKEARDLRSKLAKYEAHNKLVAVINSAKSELAVAPNSFDAHPYLINLQNGIYDLEHDVFLEHDPQLYLTKISPVTYDPDAECGDWEDHLDLCLEGNDDLISYLQTLAGYTLTGDISEQLFVLFLGPSGANGKSVTLEVFKELLGDYAIRSQIDTFMQKSGNEHKTVLYHLKGSRMVVATEPPVGKSWDDSLLKSATGEKTLTARPMRSDLIEFPITFKLWFSANNKPGVRDSSPAYWRRIKVFKFNYQIPIADQDRNKTESLMESASGIFNWMLAGHRRWRKYGIVDPPSIVREVQAYRDDEDVLLDFIRDTIDECPGHDEKSSEIFAAYTKWCDDLDIPKRGRLGAKTFPKVMEQKGYQRDRLNRGVVYRNIELKRP